MRYSILLLLLSLLGGCIGSPPMERESTLEQRQLENSTAAIATDVVRETKTDQPEVKLSQTNRDGSKTEVIVPAATESRTTATASANERGSYDASGASSWFETIPLYIKIIGLATGLLFLFAVVGIPVYVLYKRSIAARALVRTLDQGLGAAIHRIKDFTSRNIAPDEVLTLKTIESELLNLRREGSKR